MGRRRRGTLAGLDMMKVAMGNLLHMPILAHHFKAPRVHSHLMGAVEIVEMTKPDILLMSKPPPHPPNMISQAMLIK